MMKNPSTPTKLKPRSRSLKISLRGIVNHIYQTLRIFLEAVCRGGRSFPCRSVHAFRTRAISSPRRKSDDDADDRDGAAAKKYFDDAEAEDRFAKGETRGRDGQVTFTKTDDKHSRDDGAENPQGNGEGDAAAKG